MTIVTPDARNHAGLAALESRYVDVAALPWVPTRFKGVEMKMLMEDKETGLMTALVRFAPGATLPDHEHVEL
jgi:anti-sigma factor ChrR (cupin superfamily)